MGYIIRFADDHSEALDLVGGKGANLGRLTKAGFPVPAGFTVSTKAYRDVVTGDLAVANVADLAGVAPGDVAELDRATQRIRDRIEASPLPPAIVDEIHAAYAQLGEDCYVAVRSSGTAEDLADASFAGLHDTYLDIRGSADVVSAVQRCWASMWTARAAAYRGDKGFAHESSSLAVVVQTMVESDVAGVMFTGNPMTTATDEYVVNASWGLGEAVVSGLVTPDTFVLYAPKLSVEERTLGTKDREIVRDPDRLSGTLTRDVPASRQAQFSLTDGQLAELGLLGRKVTDYYDHLPQDIEWALAGGVLYLLQARPVTGVEFTWDECVDGWQPLSEDRSSVYTRAWADDIWTGAITPLFYSIRGCGFTYAHMNGQALWGLDENANRRMWQYHKGEAFFNCIVDRTVLEKVIWPQLRAPLMANIPPEWREDVLATKFSPLSYVRMTARIEGLASKQGLYRWLGTEENYMAHPEWGDGPSYEEMRSYDDAHLRRVFEQYCDLDRQYVTDLWSGYFVHINQMMSLLGYLLGKWYRGSNPLIYTDLVTGSPVRTATPHENIELWAMSRMLYRSPKLRALFAQHEDAAFFEALEDEPEAAEFLTAYRSFLAEQGHRGHAERDIYYPRRGEDPSVDYRAFKLMLEADPEHDPEHAEEKVNARRLAAIDDAVSSISAQPFGKLKAEVFKHVLDYVTRFLVDRDNERHWLDRSTYTIRRAAVVIGERLVDRGLLEHRDDAFFLIRQELYDLADGVANRTWTQAKIAGRKAAWERFARREQTPPAYLERRRPAPYGQVQHSDSGALRGMGTSRGNVTGTARIVRELKDIGRVNSHEILVVNSTDPGWTPVFLIISGIVLETGGLLAHGSCLAREYGFPAVQLPEAMTRIPDGATITIDGDTGEVTVLDGDPALADPELVGA